MHQLYSLKYINWKIEEVNFSTVNIFSSHQYHDKWRQYYHTALDYFIQNYFIYLSDLEISNKMHLKVEIHLVMKPVKRILK
jgi:hypothetical protein